MHCVVYFTTLLCFARSLQTHLYITREHSSRTSLSFVYSELSSFLFPFPFPPLKPSLPPLFFPFSVLLFRTSPPSSLLAFLSYIPYLSQWVENLLIITLLGLPVADQPHPARLTRKVSRELSSSTPLLRLSLCFMITHPSGRTRASFLPRLHV